MDLQTDYYIDEQNVMLVPSVDPPIYEAVNAVCRSFNAVDDSFAIIDNTAQILSAKRCIEDSSIILNDRASSGSSITTHENQFTAEEVTAHWPIEDLPLFPELHLLPDIVTVDENDPQISTNNEQRIESSIFTKAQLPFSMEETINISDDGNDPQIPTTDELQEEPNTEQHPTVEILMEPPQFQGRLMPQRYNTRMKVKKNLSDFIVQEQEMLDRVRKNQQRPTARVASTPHNQWIHSKDWVHINLLRVNPIKKLPNYSLTKRYKTRKTSFKN